MRPALTAALAALPLFAAGPAAGTRVQDPARPKLLLVISVDQLSADVMARYGADLPGGLGRLQREGVSFTAAYHDHAFPETGPGHSVLLSGRHPSRTGIPENNWRDPRNGQKVNCVEDPKAPILGRGPGFRGASAVHFRGGALGDWLRAEGRGSRVFSLAGKDRAAIFMGGARPTGAFWFESGLGFTTSTAYLQDLPPWLEAHNAALLARLRRDHFWWTSIAPTAGLVRNGAYQAGPTSLKAGLPRQVNPGGMPLDEGFYNRFKASPFFDETTLDAAEALLDAEKLGQGPATDVLAVGLSATDYIGHCYGSGGDEMLDQVRRLDAMLGRFLARVRERVPSAWVVLSADHGGLDIPERLAEQGFTTARRLEPRAWLANLNAGLRERLGLAADPLTYVTQPKMLHVREQPGLRRADIVRAALELLRRHPDVAEAWSAAELEAMPEDPSPDPEGRPIKALMKNGHVPGRSGDIVVALKPYLIFDDPPYIGQHGLPMDGDRRVPLIFWGPWKAGLRNEAVRTVDLAPTLARELGVAPTDAVDGRPLALERPKP
jgi:predicted AlkP superfamily pyrophosphatase or phosphodiesterase